MRKFQDFRQYIAHVRRFDSQDDNVALASQIHVALGYAHGKLIGDFFDLLLVHIVNESFVRLEKAVLKSAFHDGAAHVACANEADKHTQASFPF